MKIKALRVAEVGLFEKPVAVEGFSGGLDVLSGPNELGKSTLFRALRAVFLTRHSTTGRAIDLLASRGGARSPVIEAEFEIEGRAWKISKRYGRGKAADLHDLGSGRVVARGSDAEDQLAALIGASGGDEAAGRFGLLWVGQQQSLVLPTPDYDWERRKAVARGERATLQGAIAAEVETVAGGVLTRRIADRVAAELGEHLQPKRRAPRKGSRYEAAMRERDTLIVQRDHARVEQAKAAARLDRLDDLVKQQATEAGPERLGVLRQTQDVASKAYKEASQIAAALAHAVSREEAARLAHAQASDRFARYGEALDEVRKLEAGGARLGEDSQRIAAARASDVQAVADVEAEIGELEGALQRLSEAVERRQQHAALTSRIAAQEEALARAGALQAEIVRLEAALAANAATPERMRSLQRASQALVLARERAELPAAVDMLVALDEGGAGKVSIDGTPVPPQGRVAVDRSLRIEIAGIGRFDLVPADAEERERRRAAVAEASARVAEIESALGSGVDAEALAQARGELSEALMIARAGLAGLAGGDIDALAKAVAADRQQLAALDAAARAGGPGFVVGGASLTAGGAGTMSGQEGDGPRSDPGREQGDLQSRITAARARRDKVLETAAANRFSAERAREQGEEITRQLEVLASLLGPMAGRMAERDRLAVLRDVATEGLDKAVQERAALERACPSTEQMGKLQEASLAADAALRHGQDAAQRLAREIAALEGEIRAAGEAEIGPELTRLDAEIAGREVEVAHYEHEIAALELLQETLANVAAEHRTRFLSPVTERLAPYLAEVFGSADVGLGEGFGVESLRRGFGEEPVEGLSDGTREQLAVLVRLGFGRLLADTGSAAPVILDDALVFSDDERIMRMFGALRMAATRHQVIVFTCRSATFAQLGGTRLEIRPWQGAAV